MAIPPPPNFLPAIGKRKRLTLTVTSFPASGGAVSTTNAKARFDPVTGVVYNRKTDSPSELFAYHLRKLGSRTLLKFEREEDYWTFLQKRIDEARDARFKRGQYVEMTPEQVETLRRHIANKTEPRWIIPRNRVT